MTEKTENPDRDRNNISVDCVASENNDTYKSLFKNSNAIMLLIDPDTSQIIDANIAACNYYGWSYEELINKKIYHINTLTAEKIDEEMKNAVLDMRNYFFFKHKLSNGDIRNVEVYSSSITLNSKKLLYSIIHDITERKIAEEELKKKKMQLSTAQKVGHIGSYQIDLNSGIVDASDEAMKIYGIENENLTLEKIKTIPLPEYRQMLDTALGELVNNCNPYNVQFKIKRKCDGKVRDIHSIAEYYTKRNVIVGTIQDITNQKEAENALLHAKLIAEAASNSKDQFLATMSHELRTPLTSIIGFSEILLEEMFGPLNDKQKQHVTHVLNGGHHLLELINDILDLSKVEAGKMELNYEDFTVSIAIHEVELMTHPLSLKKNISVTLVIDPNLNSINADRTKFKQILYNLLSNAIKFTEKKGKVNVHANKIDSFIQISVNDNGIGISKENIKELFQPFKQLDPYINREYAGTGLGLALTKKFVEMQGGSIWVESDLGIGSTFTFSIPCK